MQHLRGEYVNGFNREALDIEIDLNFPAPRGIRVLERTIAWRGYPKKLRVDNGPGIISTVLAEWAESHQVQLEFIQPGTLTQNAYTERFNHTNRKEILNRHIFKT